MTVAAMIVAIVLGAAAVLLAMGRSPICACGTLRLCAGEVKSAENSQQPADRYSLSHVVHGLLFYVWMLVAPNPAIVRWQAG